MITACENVCRDFSWLGSFSDWGPAMLASATALVIAFKAYPQQKNEDRKLQIALEQRKAYEELVMLFTESRLTFSDIDYKGYQSLLDSISKVRSAQRALLIKAKAVMILVHIEIAPFLRDCHESIADVLKKLSEELTRITEEQDIDAEFNGDFIRQRCQPVVKKAIENLDLAINALVNEIRLRTYDLPSL